MYIYDLEVFKYDWIVIFKNLATKETIVFHNDNDSVAAFVTSEKTFIGFNNKNYDNYILKAICCGADTNLIKDINDWIIAQEQNAWDHLYIKTIKYYFDSFDLKDDTRLGLSLKEIEAHLGIDIEESSVSFNIDRPLNDEELKETIFYCGYDVDATEILFHLREVYIQNKLMLGRLKNIPDVKALYMTNAKLTSAYLDAKKTKEFNDSREYTYPNNLLKEFIPQEAFDFFDKLKDKSIPDSVVFKSSHTLYIGECKIKLAYGGIHGAIPYYQEESTDNRSIRNKDVGSYYPHLMTIDGYCSRNIPNPNIYAEMLDTRMKAKKDGDKATANALKLVANTTYGAMLNAYNELFDPLMGRSVCITGQLRLLELANHLATECKSLKVIQVNTDGIMVSLDNSDLEKYNTICDEWEKRTKFELEEDLIKKIIQKDVNNYIEIATNDSVKLKGGWLVRGIVTNGNINLNKMGLFEWKQLFAGAFNINNNATIVPEAIVNYFINGVPVEETINKCNEKLKFQLVAKASSKYTRVFQLINNEQITVQKCNRVYASNDYEKGKLYMIHGTTQSVEQISNLPEHCIIDNKNNLTIDVVDKRWYINLAKRYINGFLGLKIKKPNARKIKSIYQKINNILEENINGNK